MMLTSLSASMLADTSRRMAMLRPPRFRPVRYWRLPSPTKLRALLPLSSSAAWRSSLHLFLERLHLGLELLDGLVLAETVFGTRRGDQGLVFLDFLADARGPALGLDDLEIVSSRELRRATRFSSPTRISSSSSSPRTAGRRSVPATRTSIE
jgi:hypothetical protein